MSVREIQCSHRLSLSGETTAHQFVMIPGHSQLKITYLLINVDRIVNFCYLINSVFRSIGSTGDCKEFYMMIIIIIIITLIT